MTIIRFDTTHTIPTARRRAELVERKGIGHPDTMCDAMMEAASVALCQYYHEHCGRILHYNLDKSLLVAGQSQPRLGGGEIVAPMRLVFGDRATQLYKGHTVLVAEIVQAAASKWLREHLRYVDPAVHLVYQNEIQPGSPELVDIFAREDVTANDTSAAVGYAPLTETEQLVLETERFLNSPDFKQRFPFAGEDVKVMAQRQDRTVSLTVALAFVDRFITSAEAYFQKKAEIEQALHCHLEPRLKMIEHLELFFNTLDDPTRGAGGMYLTVLGTSAEGADGGQVGRGNRVNGLISLHRPMSTEAAAAAGKNPVSHVGKIYNVMAHQLTQRICQSIPGVEEATVWLCSQIGRPLNDPWSISVELVPVAGHSPEQFEQPVCELIANDLQQLSQLITQLSCGEISVY